jgi:hypothetical protein
MAWESEDGREVEGKSSQDDLVAAVGRGQNQKLCCGACSLSRSGGNGRGGPTRQAK